VAGEKRLYQRYYCEDCGLWFNDRTGTATTFSRLPLRFWFFTAFRMHFKVSVCEMTPKVTMLTDVLDNPNPMERLFDDS